MVVRRIIIMKRREYIWGDARKWHLNHQSPVTPNPQSLIPSYLSLLSSRFSVGPRSVPPFDSV